MNELVPIALIALELGVPLDRLIAKLDPNRILLNRAGLRCIETSTAAAVVDQHHADQARAKRRSAEHRQRTSEALQRNRAALHGRGIPASPNSNALADMMAADRQ